MTSQPVSAAKPQANALALLVSDVAASAAFYQRFGLDFGDTSHDHVECDLTPDFKLMLDDAAMVRSLYPDWTKPTGGAHAAIAFEFDSPAQVDVKHQELTAAGFHSIRDPWDAAWGHRYATVLDPDGNNVDLYARLPES